MKTKQLTALHIASFLIPLTFPLVCPKLALSAEKMTPGTYVIDENHTKVGFEVPHMVISSVEGHFKSFAGEVTIGNTFNKSTVNTTIQTASIDTGNSTRDQHLRSEDFFNAEKFPDISFKTKSISGTPASFKLTGDLTIKGVTKEVVLHGKYKGTVLNMKGIPTTAFEASTQINRKDFGLMYNKLIEAGPAIGDKVTISLKTEAVLKKDEDKSAQDKSADNKTTQKEAENKS